MANEKSYKIGSTHEWKGLELSYKFSKTQCNIKIVEAENLFGVDFGMRRRLKIVYVTN